MEEDKRQSSINDNEPVETADNRQFYIIDLEDFEKENNHGKKTVHYTQY